ncbi:carbohydrate ABC transporter substrate-binding protein (CUT1 family) [Motilibacter rhizosphaerae]|uniref:Carbohydrate ABC transporter substrate-binding protein (CUT1 family) n=1 Tax=Motilibacter rhizosphaerae TaxID=598652 RepID=A0A4Q7NV62_9ACTN|nr:sugar ABC transporter substrate-binding protein [Motilibacter rhizosphaerae]RZS91121.1 carbohydrate ABC transporter substrate-binding protein (CUT1 family) [Motilibacter rhizosphaerae]
MSRKTRTSVGLVGLATAASLALAACGSSSGSDTASSTSSGGSAAAAGAGGSDKLAAALQKGGELTYWTWTPSAQAQVKAFEAAYPKVKVNLVNAGTGNDEYTKLQNAVKAGSGAPDVAQIEYFALPQFALSDSLLDLSGYGFSSLADRYGAGTFGSVSIGGKVYGLPQDSGPMALFYNKKVFAKDGVAVPKTWDEYVAAAKKIHAADPKAYITSDTGDAGMTTSLIWQAGGRPFRTDGTKVSVDLQDPGTKKWTAVWSQLIQGKLLSPTPGWTDDWYKQLGNGQIASLVTGAWMPGVLEGSVKAASGDWAVAPIPTYDGKPVTANNGGSAESVMKQSKTPDLAAAFLKWLNASPDSIKVFLANGGFPATKADLSSPEFVATKPAYFSGQAINEVLQGAANTVSAGWNYLPYQVYANSVFGDTVGKAYQGGGSLDDGLKAWQDAIVKYGKQQGFDVTAT